MKALNLSSDSAPSVINEIGCFEMIRRRLTKAASRRFSPARALCALANTHISLLFRLPR
jgi:hypothetical protein